MTHPSSAPVPFRTELRTAAPEAIAELNVCRAARGEPPVLPTDEALYEIDLAPVATAEDVTRWLAHPDERVALHLIDALVDERRGERWHGRRVLALHAEVVRTLIDRAESEGLYWTPLLDKAESHLLWQTRTLYRPLEGVPTPDVQREKLIPYIQREADPNRLRTLLASSCSAFPRLVARHATSLDRPLIARLADEDRVLDALVQNPAITGGALEWVMRRVIECDEAKVVDSTIDALNRRGAVVTDRLFRVAFLEDARAEGEGRGQRRPLGREPAHWPARRTLVRLHALTADQLRALTTDLPTDMREQWTWTQIAAHPAADLELVRQAYETTPATHAARCTLLRRIVHRADVRADSFMKEAIRRWGDWCTRLQIADELSAGELEAVASEMTRRASPPELVAMLEEGTTRLPVIVTRALLSHEDQEVRLAAACALGSVLDPSTPEPEPQRPSRPGRAWRA